MTDLIIHVMPYDGIGGVEKAAATAEGASREGVVLQRLFAFQYIVNQSDRLKTFNPWAFWTAAGRLTRSKPSLVIVSLWRSALVVLLSRLRGCRAPAVLFLHNAKDAHLVDQLVTRIAALGSVAIWADSEATLNQRMTIGSTTPTRIISYLPRRISPIVGPSFDPKPNFIFWGRLAPQKDILMSLKLFSRIKDHMPSASFQIIGPDGGARRMVVDEIYRLGLESCVKLHGSMTWDQISIQIEHCSFYLQTSRYEGMALSVVEAMQAGLVPVVKPVGEIFGYTVDGESAIWLGDGPDAIEPCAMRIVRLISKPEEWRTIRATTVEVWKNQPLYRDDILSASKEVMQGVERTGC